MEHTISDLYQMQSLPLRAKVLMTKQRIRDWYDHYNGEVYVSFSGGKDSTVLLDITRSMYADVEAVFVDTGLEYPEIREFVKTFDNVTILKPKKTFKQVINEYGYPFFSKEISEAVYYGRKYLTRLAEIENANDRQTDRQTDRKIVGASQFADLLGVDRRKDKNNKAWLQIKTGNIPSCPIRVQQLLGIAEGKDGEDTTLFDKSKYIFMLDAPFEISNRCCGVMKKAPIKQYNKATGKKPITAQMAEESMQRTQKWLKNGCNGFEMNNPISNPLSFWTEQDILEYIKENNLPICSVYGDIVIDYEAEGQLEGQLELFERPHKLKTTGCNRTGCMFCGFGCHLEKQSRFELMKRTHPKQYEYIMKPKEEGGLDYKNVIDWINEHGKMNIRY